jgi:hypothetical protein
MKPWTYAELTEATERTIVDAMTEAARKEDSRAYQFGAALGAHSLWAFLTIRRVDPAVWAADNERLRGLIKNR